jgi:hypothetical protein
MKREEKEILKEYAEQEEPFDFFDDCPHFEPIKKKKLEDEYAYISRYQE